MILIIDDDSSIRKSLALLLKRAGHSTDTASGADEALAKIRANRYGLIIMDMNFGLSITGREGIELLMKTKILRPDTPVILITAWGSIELAVEGMRAGAYDFITKPWNNRLLLQRVETALSLNNGGEAPPPPSAATESSATTGACSNCSTLPNAWLRPTRRCSSSARTEPAKN